LKSLLPVQSAANGPPIYVEAFFSLAADGRIELQPWFGRTAADPKFEIELLISFRP
jgi:hypothetical protein